MRRLYLILIGIIALIFVLAIYVLLARPVLVLPPITIPVSGSNAIGAYQQQLGINELNATIRTDGNLVVTADGQPLARFSYTLASLNNSSDLAQQMLLPPSVRTTVRILSYLFPQVASNVYLTGLCVYYFLPVQVTIRILRE